MVHGQVIVVLMVNAIRRSGRAGRRPQEGGHGGAHAEDCNGVEYNVDTVRWMDWKEVKSTSDPSIRLLHPISSDSLQRRRTANLSRLALFCIPACCIPSFSTLFCSSPPVHPPQLFRQASSSTSSVWHSTKPLISASALLRQSLLAELAQTKTKTAERNLAKEFLWLSVSCQSGRSSHPLDHHIAY